MILVTGGSFQGKKNYAAKKFHMDLSQMADGVDCPGDAVYAACGIFHFHEYLRRLLEDGKKQDPAVLASGICENNPDVVIITNELGMGVVPMDRFDREYREYTGRVCCELAKRAAEVHRVICGIGTVIKGA